MPLEELAKLVTAAPELSRVGTELAFFDPADGSYIVRSTADRQGSRSRASRCSGAPSRGSRCSSSRPAARRRRSWPRGGCCPTGATGSRRPSSCSARSPRSRSRTGRRERTLWWTSCWQCPGETGHVSVRDDHHVVIVAGLSAAPAQSKTSVAASPASPMRASTRSSTVCVATSTPSTTRSGQQRHARATPRRGAARSVASSSGAQGATNRREKRADPLEQRELPRQRRPGRATRRTRRRCRRRARGPVAPSSRHVAAAPPVPVAPSRSRRRSSSRRWTRERALVARGWWTERRRATAPSARGARRPRAGGPRTCRSTA